MGAHRYWGLDGFARTGSGNTWAISEIEMRATPGGADQCNGGTAYATDNLGGSSFTPDKAFDNNNGTEWIGTASTVTSGRIWYDFGTPVDVQQISYRSSISAAYQNGTWIRVVFSDNGTRWYVGSGSFSAAELGLAETLIVDGVSDVLPGAKALPAFNKAVYAPPTWPAVPRVLQSSIKLRDVYHGGRGRVSGTVKIKGTPNYAVHRHVVLHRQRDNMAIRAMWSDKTTGEYQFDFVDPAERYYVVSFDYEHNFRAVIADNLTPDLIP